MYLKERLLISLNPQKLFLARSNAKSHNFFIWVVMFINLTIFWVWENRRVFSFSEHRNWPLILEDQLFIELSTTSSLTDAFCSSSTALVPFAPSNIS